MAAGKSKVEILPFHQVTIGDHLALPGEIVEVDAKDAATLITEGYAQKT